tara:strand:+ start:1418 stop:1756 length:339 start_codon:yes stop_codon:yes gene_type:complete
MYKFTYNNEQYDYNPENPVIIGIDSETGEMQFGDQLKTVLGMTDSEAQQCHATGLLNELRGKRDELLKETDWVGGTDVPQSLKDTWETYRQQLRDITSNYTSLDDVVWPEKP